jgi:hypothetical protein
MTTLRVYDAPSINPDFYSAMLDLGACAMWLLALQAPRRRTISLLALLAGLAWGASTMVKPTGCVGLFAATVATLMAVALKSDSKQAWVRATVASWIGFAVVLAASAAVLVKNGTLSEAWSTFTFNHGLLDWDRLMAAASSAGRLWAALKPVQLALWLATIGLAAWVAQRITLARAGRAVGEADEGSKPPFPKGLTTWKREQPSPSAPSSVEQNRGSAVFETCTTLRGPVVTMMVLWWTVQCVPALMGPSQSMRYWQATWPPMLWLAAVGIEAICGMFRRADRTHKTVMALLLGTCVWCLGWLTFDHHRHGVASAYLHHTGDKNERGQFEAWAERLREIVPTGESIYVWAYDAGWYVHAQRHAACRFTYPRSPEQMEEIISTLETRVAKAILVPARAAPTFAPYCGDSCRDRMAVLLAGYTQEMTLGPYTVWIRRESNEGAAG